MSPFEFTNPVDAGDLATISCAVIKGDFPLRIFWTHNSYNITPVEGIVITRMSRRISQLTIDSVQASHSGEYVCTAKNRAGLARHTAILNVNGYYSFSNITIVVIIWPGLNFFY